MIILIFCLYDNLFNQIQNIHHSTQGVRESSSKVPIISQGAKSCYLMSRKMDKKVWDAANPEAPDGRCEIN